MSHSAFSARPRRYLRILSILLVGLAVAAGEASARRVQSGRAGDGAGAPSQPRAVERTRAAHLLSRATFGVRPSDIDGLLAVGADAWLERQLHPAGISDPGVDTRLARFNTLTTPPGELLIDARAAARSARQRERMTAADSTAEMQNPRQRAPNAPPSPRVILAELVTARLIRAVHSERQLEEVMTAFWFNHFNVYFGKGLDRYLIADYERNAIRPHVFGRFEDMLRATATHPAMLFYLDNWTSVAPESLSDRAVRTPTARQRQRLQREGRVTGEQQQRLDSLQARRRSRGINENYARELLELHTLGVDGGYTQRDVTEVARAFTGWTFRRPNARAPDAPVEFVFRPAMHDTAEKTVLGVILPAGRGVEDGEDVIRMLAAHPSTATRLATRLVEHFVTDEPAPDLVAELAAVYLRTDGDLRELTRALFTSERFYDERWLGAKVKTPFELVSSALRVLEAEVRPSRAVVRTLTALGQLPYTEPAPTGFPSQADAWVNSGAMIARMNFGLALGSGQLDGIRVDAARVLERTAGVDAGGGRDPGAGRATAPEPLSAPDSGIARILARLLPETPAAALEATILGDLAERPQLTDRERATRALGLALGSPEFQRR